MMASCNSPLKQKPNCDDLTGGKIRGVGTIICVQEGFGILKGPEKQLMYFGEKTYLPFTTGILQVLKRKDTLHFEAKPSKKNSKIKWVATKIWKPEYNHVIEGKEVSKSKGKSKDSEKVSIASDLFNEEEMRAMDYLRFVLQSEVSIEVQNLVQCLQQAPPEVRATLADEQKITAILMRYPSIFNLVGKHVSLVTPEVHEAIEFLIGEVQTHEDANLALLFDVVNQAPESIRAICGLKKKQLKLFLGTFVDVFSVLDDGSGQCNVSLKPTFRQQDDTASVGSSSSWCTFDSANLPSLSTASSMVSLSASSNPYGSVDELFSNQTPKQQGIIKLLNALLKKEPQAVKNLIGYIHGCSPEIRSVIGNKIETFTEFVRTDPNFFFLPQQNVVFIRTTVETRALHYLVDVVRKKGPTSLNDLLKHDVIETTLEVKALLGSSVAEILAAIHSLLAKKLMRDCNLVVVNGFLCDATPSHPLPCAAGYQLSAECTEQANGAGNSLQQEVVSSSKITEIRTVSFLTNLLETHQTLAIASMGVYLQPASRAIRRTLADEQLVRAFVQRHPSIFKLSELEDLVELTDDAVRDTIGFFVHLLNVKGDLRLASLVGHQSAASQRIRFTTGGSPQLLEAFLRKYFDVFRVYGSEGEAMVSVRSTESNVVDALQVGAASAAAAREIPLPDGKDEALSLNHFNKVAAKTPAVSETVSITNSERNERVVETPRNSADEDLATEFIVDLLRNQGALTIKNIRQYIAEASDELQAQFGRTDKEVLSFIEENPSLFKISSQEGPVELLSDDEGDVIEFFLDILNKRGSTPVSKLHGHLSQAAANIRLVTGGSPESVKAYLMQFPNVFKIYKENGVEMIGSQYESNCISESGEANATVAAEAAVSTASSEVTSSSLKFEEREKSGARLSTFDEIDFSSVAGIPRKVTTTSDAPVESELVFHQDLPVIYDRERVASSCLELSDADGSDDEDRQDTSRVDLTDGGQKTDECHIGVTAFPADSHFSAEIEGGETFGKHSELPAVISCDKDERNIVADLCYEVLLTKNAVAMKLSELLMICKQADPLKKDWQNTLNLDLLDKIITADDRFLLLRSSQSVNLQRDIEAEAVLFFREHILRNGPISKNKLNYYLSYASAEVQALFGCASGVVSAGKRQMSLLCQKYRDQLSIVSGSVIVPQDVLMQSVAFLSTLIETHGPVPLQSLTGFLSQAPTEICDFLTVKLSDISSFLSRHNLNNHFCVVKGVLDLVRSSYRQKNRFVVEQMATTFLAGMVRSRGILTWKEMSKWFGTLQSAKPELRALCGQWQFISRKKSVLKKFCADRPDVFVVSENGVHLVGHTVDSLLDAELVASAAVTDLVTENAKVSEITSPNQMAIQFLKETIKKSGPIGCKKKSLKTRKELANACPVVRELLGGGPAAVNFDKQLLRGFCARHPSVFVLFNKSVHLTKQVQISMQAETASFQNSGKGLSTSERGSEVSSANGVSLGQQNAKIQVGQFPNITHSVTNPVTSLPPAQAQNFPFATNPFQVSARHSTPASAIPSHSLGQFQKNNNYTGQGVTSQPQAIPNVMFIQNPQYPYTSPGSSRSFGQPPLPTLYPTSQSANVLVNGVPNVVNLLDVFGDHSVKPPMQSVGGMCNPAAGAFPHVNLEPMWVPSSVLLQPVAPLPPMPIQPSGNVSGVNREYVHGSQSHSWQGLPGNATSMNPPLSVKKNLARSGNENFEQARYTDTDTSKNVHSTNLHQAADSMRLEGSDRLSSAARFSKSSAWKSLAANARLEDLKEDFDKALTELANVADFIREVSQQIDSVHRPNVESDSAECSYLTAVDENDLEKSETVDLEAKEREFEEQENEERGAGESGTDECIAKEHGIVLSAIGGLVYIKMDDGRCLSFASKDCCHSFTDCIDLGRHFAFGEKVDVVKTAISDEIFVTHSSPQAQVFMGDDVLSADRCCCDERITSGRGRIAIVNECTVAILMSNHEMAAYVGEISSRFVLGEIVSFSAHRVPGFLTPWQVDRIWNSVAGEVTTFTVDDRMDRNSDKDEVTALDDDMGRNLNDFEGEVATQDDLIDRNLNSVEGEAAAQDDQIDRNLNAVEGEAVTLDDQIDRNLNAVEGEAVTLDDQIDRNLNAVEGEAATLDDQIDRNLNAVEGEAATLDDQMDRNLNAVKGEVTDPLL